MLHKRERIYSYDILRIIAAFSVVALHCAGQFWYVLDVNAKEWLIANSYDALFRYGVPIFVMLSGALFLDFGYKLDIKRLYGHNILRLLILYGVWSALYGLFDCRNYDLQAIGIKGVLREMLMGRYHLWFLPMLAGIYMLLPVLKSWIEKAEQKVIEYFLILFFVFQICRETLKALILSDELLYILDVFELEMAGTYIGYFVLGYYLVHIGLSKKLKQFFYIMIVPAAVLNVVLGNWLALRIGQPTGAIYDSYGLFTFIMTVAVFVFVIDQGRIWKFSQRKSKLIKEVSADTLGIYVLHIGVIEFLEPMGVHSMMIPNIIGIPVFTIVCFVICLCMAALLRRIPFVGKYIC